MICSRREPWLFAEHDTVAGSAIGLYIGFQIRRELCRWIDRLRVGGVRNCPECRHCEESRRKEYSRDQRKPARCCSAVFVSHTSCSTHEALYLVGLSLGKPSGCCLDASDVPHADCRVVSTRQFSETWALCLMAPSPKYRQRSQRLLMSPGIQAGQMNAKYIPEP